MDYIRSFCGLPELDMTYMIYYLDSGCTAFKLKISSLGIVRGVLLLLAMLAAPWQQILLAMLYGMPWYGMVWYIHSVHTLLYQIIDHICNIYIYAYVHTLPSMDIHHRRYVRLCMDPLISDQNEHPTAGEPRFRHASRGSCRPGRGVLTDSHGFMAVNTFFSMFLGIW